MSTIDVVIINHNTRGCLQQCLATLVGQRVVEEHSIAPCAIGPVDRHMGTEAQFGKIWVVDNASTDDSVAMVRREFPQVSLILNERNPGYGAAANQAIARSTATWVLLLNSDTLLPPGTLDALLRYGAATPRAAIIGPRLLNRDGTLQSSTYPLPTPLPIFLEESTVGRYLRYLPFARERYLRTWSHDAARSVPWLLGAVLCIRRDAFQAVGGFDEAFFMYLEEVDLCLRLRTAGWQIHFTPVATVTHLGGASTAQYGSAMTIQYFVSLLQFYHKHFTRPQALLLRLLFMIIVGLRLGRDCLLCCLAETPERNAMVRERVQTWRQFFGRIFARAHPHPISRGGGTQADVQASAVAAPLSEVAQPRQRLDWRFLLPPHGSERYQHLVILGASASLLAALKRSDIAVRISTTLPAPGTADTLIILQPTPVQAASLSDVVAVLQPGGVLYLEVDRRLRQQWLLSPQRLQQRLATLGCEAINLYWVAPNFAQARRYLPLAVPQILRWYLRQLYIAGAWHHLLIARALAWLGDNQMNWFAALMPCYCVTTTLPGAVGVQTTHAARASTPGTEQRNVSEEAQAVNQLSGQQHYPNHDPQHHPIGLLQRAADAGILAATNWYPVLLTSGYDAGSRAIVLPFRGDGTAPETVLKVATQRTLNHNTEREQLLLAEAREWLSPTTRTAIPEPKGLFYYDDLAVSAEAYAAGPALTVTSGHRRATVAQQIDDLHHVGHWITTFHCETAQQPFLWNERAVTDYWDKLVATYRHTAPLTAAEEALFARTRAYAQSLSGLSLPLVWVHYDLGPWNLYRTQNPQSMEEGALIVSDWEFGRAWPAARTGLPLTDLLYFVVYWLYVVEHIHSVDKELRLLHELFVQPQHAQTAQRQAAWLTIHKYLQALNLDQRFLPFLLIYLWLEQAVHQCERKHLLEKANAHRRQQLKSVQYLQYFASIQEELFAACG